MSRSFKTDGRDEICAEVLKFAGPGPKNNTSEENNSIKCLLCGIIFHKQCQTGWMDLYHKDGSWLCQTCTTIEINWSKEDFDYDLLYSRAQKDPMYSSIEKGTFI